MSARYTQEISVLFNGDALINVGRFIQINTHEYWCSFTKNKTYALTIAYKHKFTSRHKHYGYICSVSSDIWIYVRKWDRFIRHLCV